MFNPRQLLWWASILAEAILLARLVSINLHRTYFWFAAYIFGDIACSLVMTWWTPDPHTRAYAVAWFWTQPIVSILQLAVCIELYRMIAGHYRNFDRMRPRLFWTCLVSATAVSALSMFIDLRHINWASPLLQGIFLAKRTATFALGGFVVATSTFVRLFPIPIRSNVTAHRRIATVYFLANAANYFAIDVGLMNTYAAGIVLMVITGSCFAAWTVFLKPQGEEVDSHPPPSDGEIKRHLRRGDELLRWIRGITPWRRPSDRLPRRYFPENP